MIDRFTTTRNQRSCLSKARRFWKWRLNKLSHSTRWKSEPVPQAYRIPQNWSFMYVPRSLSSWITPPLFSPGGSRHSPGDQRHLLPSRCSARAQGEAFQKLSIKKVQPILNWEIQIPVFFHITFSYHQGEWHALSRQSWGIHKWKRWTQNCQLRPFSK